MNERKNRFSLGSMAAHRLMRYFGQLKMITCKMGQENWLDSDLHYCIRGIHDSVTVDYIRFKPDLVAFHPDFGCFCIEVKATSERHWYSPNFAIETKSLQTLKLLSKMGILILLVWENQPNQFYGVWIDENQPPIFKQFSIKQSRTFEGSGTPMTLVRKRSVPSLHDLFSHLR